MLSDYLPRQTLEIAELQYLMGKARAGEISGLCYSVVTNKACHSGYVKVPGCGMHELVGWLLVPLASSC